MKKVLLFGSKNRPRIEMFDSFVEMNDTIKKHYPANQDAFVIESEIKEGQIVLISGNSYPENVLETYQGFYDEFTQLLREKKDVVLVICFEMFNTGTSKLIGTTIKDCRTYKQQGGNVEVFWLAIDQEYKDAGANYQVYCKDKEPEIIKIVELFSNEILSGEKKEKVYASLFYIFPLVFIFKIDTNLNTLLFDIPYLGQQIAHLNHISFLATFSML